MDVVIWTGPVSASNLKGIAWGRPTKIVTVNHRDWPGPQQGPARPEITGSNAFGTLAARLGPRPVSAILAAAGVDETPERIALMGYSAGHGLMNPILLSEEADRIDAFGAFDAYFTNATKAVKKGYLRHIQRAASGEALAIVTTSSNGDVGVPPADKSFALLNELVPGVSAEAPPDGVPEPASYVGTGLYGWADYEARVSHENHVHSLVVPWANATIAPYLAGGTPEGLEGGGGGGGLSIGKVCFGLALLVAVGAVARELAG
jgi:hypothetical protein